MWRMHHAYALSEHAVFDQLTEQKDYRAGLEYEPRLKFYTIENLVRRFRRTASHTSPVLKAGFALFSYRLHLACSDEAIYGT